ncbi:unnamed protein product [Prunus armeniaca]|uniref:Helicase ATP-binding domain-containing protein n=1 Tax=Prunus armeniaca TaxID=36596 RepID=A0A6J5VK84_PRUAR|nr:unnamed protein product [Prunus armeniaca]
MLLQKASDKFKLYSVIILDEVHELRLNTDLLIGMLSGVISARHVKLDVVLISAKTCINQERQVLRRAAKGGAFGKNDKSWAASFSVKACADECYLAN